MLHLPQKIDFQYKKTDLSVDKNEQNLYLTTTKKQAPLLTFPVTCIRILNTTGTAPAVMIHIITTSTLTGHSISFEYKYYGFPRPCSGGKGKKGHFY